MSMHLGLGLGLGQSGGVGIAKSPGMILEFNITTGNTITLPIVVNKTYIPEGKTLTVDWGDGTSDNYSGVGEATPTHTYSITNSAMRVKLSGVGSLIRFGLDSAWDETKLTKCLAFGQTLGIVSFYGAFWGCTNLTYVPNILPPNVTDMSFMFYGCTAFNQDISGWNVSNVTSMGAMFRDATAFNQNIGSWNVSKVTNMEYMFRDATAFNQNISSWNVSKVTNMEYMFSSATAFNQNISSWNVSKVTNMEYMFRDATAFNQNISSWNVSNVTNMRYMFSSATAFNQNISSWNVSKVTNMGSMFSYATAFNQNISSWNVSNVTSMGAMFRDATAFNQNLASWKLKKAAGSTTIASLFRSCGLSTANFELIIIGWAAHVLSTSGGATGLPSGLSLTWLGSTLYDFLSDAGAETELGLARDYLTRPVIDGGAGWTFSS